MLESVFYGTAFITATADEAIGQYLIVKRTDSANEFPKIALCDATDTPAGIATQPADSGSEVASYAYDGIGRVKVNGGTNAIAIASPIKSTTDGIGILAYWGDKAIAKSNGISSADGDIIPCQLGAFTVSTPLSTAITQAADPATVTRAQLFGKLTNITNTVDGTSTLNIPGAASVNAGTQIQITKTGTAGAITVTPAAGTINGTSTYILLDADNDTAVFESDGVSNWFIVSSVIA